MKYWLCECLGTSQRASGELGDDPWLAIDELLNRPWWSRTWIVQEATVPEQPTFVFCGDYVVGWTNFHTAIGVIQTMGTKPQYSIFNKIETTRASKLLSFQLRRYVGGERLDLVSLLSECRGLDATDPRDKVYGITALAKNTKDFKSVQPNYNKSLKEVYTDVVHYCISTSHYSGKLDILGYCSDQTLAQTEALKWLGQAIEAIERANDNEEAVPHRLPSGEHVSPSSGSKEETRSLPTSEVLPSWVPDWRYEVFHKPFFKKLQLEPGYLGGHNSAANAYLASGDDPEIISEYKGDGDLIYIEGDQLHLKGFQIDVIGELSACSDDWNGTGEPEQLLWEPLHIGTNYVATGENTDLVGPFKNQTESLVGESVHEAFLRTLVADIKLEAAGPLARGNSLAWTSNAPSPIELPSRNDRLLELSLACTGRRLAITDGKLIGLVPEHSEKGDLVYLLFGGQVLYVLRPFQDYYQFIGECYMHGMMDGEALKRFRNGTVQVNNIIIK
jgi:hypothetical protein